MERRGGWAVALRSRRDHNELIETLPMAGYEVRGCDGNRLPSDVTVLVMEDSARCAAEYVSSLRSAGFPGPIVTVCGTPTVSEVHRLRTAGASVITKSARHEDVLDALELARAGGASASHEQPLHFRLDANSRVVEIGVVQTTLRPTEFALLEYMARHPGRWHKAAALIAKVLGSTHAHDSSLVRVHAHRIRKRLGIARWCLRSERTWGYMFTTDPDACHYLRSRFEGWTSLADRRGPQGAADGEALTRGC